ncbi:hypothetical protein [Promicromonospora sp. NPDC050249]|uniref:hypothetical protein n=1 Tax=Promicromonospora sp. NPDC050249 TaxID=3154743 RepID=UPI0033C80F19
MTTPLSRTSVLLSLQSALWDAVTPGLRGVAVRFGEARIEGRMIYDHVPGPTDHEDCSLVETYVIADFPQDVAVSLDAVAVVPPEPRLLLAEGVWVYLRKEPARPDLWHPHRRSAAEIAQRLIDTTEWSRYELMDGPASDFGNALSAFIADASVDQWPALWATMENRVFSQDDIFSAAEPALRVLLAALVDGADASARLGILDLIFHIVHAASYRDDDLGVRCVSEAAAASWLLVREAVKGDQKVAVSCIEILDITSPEYAELVRATRG